MPLCCFTGKFPCFFFSSIRFMSFAASLDFRLKLAGSRWRRRRGGCLDGWGWYHP